MNPALQKYHEQLDPCHRHLCDLLAKIITKQLPEAESKIWHRHPVWFLNGNPTVGYSRQKPGIRLMFWSGADFGKEGLKVVGRTFKDASVFYNHASEINRSELLRWLDGFN